MHNIQNWRFSIWCGNNKYHCDEIAVFLPLVAPFTWGFVHQCPLRGQTQSVLLPRHLHRKDFIITFTTKTQARILSFEIWNLVLIRVVHLCPRAGGHCTVNSWTVLIKAKTRRLTWRVQRPSARLPGWRVFPKCLCPSTSPARRVLDNSWGRTREPVFDGQKLGRYDSDF